MAETLFSQKYSVIRVLDSTDGINYYIVQLKNNTEKMFIVNEICDKQKISLVISEIMLLEKEKNLTEFIEYFSENSKFYVVFEYYCQPPLKRYLEIENLGFLDRIMLVKNLLTVFIDYVNIPNIIKYSMIQPDNIAIYKNSLLFNYKLILPDNSEIIEDKKIYNSIKILLKVVFSDREIQKNSKLNIIYDKAEKGIYSSIGEILKDLDDLIENLNREVDIKLVIQEKKKKIMLFVGKIFAIVVVFLALYMIYNEFFKDDLKNSIYTPVMYIGNVPVNVVEEETTSPNDVIYVDNRPTEFPTEAVTEPATEPYIPPTTEIFIEPEEETHSTEPEEEIYLVKKGDTIFGICFRKYKNTKYISFIAEYNNLSDKNLIEVGQEIKLPSEEYIKQNYK